MLDAIVEVRITTSEPSGKQRINVFTCHSQETRADEIACIISNLLPSEKLNKDKVFLKDCQFYVNDDSIYIELLE